MKSNKEIKIMVLRNESSSDLSPDEKYRYDAYLALWHELIKTFINDEDLIPSKPNLEN